MKPFSNILTREPVDEIPDESAEVVLDLPDAGHKVLVALALQVQPGALDVVGERGDLELRSN